MKIICYFLSHNREAMRYCTEIWKRRLEFTRIMFTIIFRNKSSLHYQAKECKRENSKSNESSLKNVTPIFAQNIRGDCLILTNFGLLLRTIHITFRFKQRSMFLQTAGKIKNAGNQRYLYQHTNHKTNSL